LAQYQILLHLIKTHNTNTQNIFKMKYTKHLAIGLIIFLFSSHMMGQAQSTIEVDSDDIDRPQLLLLETETGDGGDFARLWFKHSLEPANRWAVVARTQEGTTSNDGAINQPMVFAYNGIGRLSISKEGKLRINNQYIFPEVDGAVDQKVKLPLTRSQQF